MSTPTIATVQARQLAAARALADLLARDLPTASWQISASTAVAHGQIGQWLADAATRRAQIGQWAEFLDAEPFEKRFPKWGNGGLFVEGNHMGVFVQVWTPLDAGDLTPAPERGTGECPDSECWGCSYCEGPTDAEQAEADRPVPVDLADDEPADHAPAYDLPQLTVACPICDVAPGELCTSHGGERVRRTDTHQTRTTAWTDAQFAANPAARLILTASKERRGMHGRHAADLLEAHGHTEAAEIVRAEVKARNGLLSAKQAAHLLITKDGAQ